MNDLTKAQLCQDCVHSIPDGLWKYLWKCKAYTKPDNLLFRAVKSYADCMEVRMTLHGGRPECPQFVKYVPRRRWWLLGMRY